MEETGKSSENISDAAVYLGQNMKPGTVELKIGIPQTAEI
jgi:hypothetical protein